MHDLVRNEVTEYEIRREDEAPVEGQVPAGRAVAPLRALTHHVDPPGLLPNARDHHGQVVRNSRARLSSKPVLETARRRRLRLGAAANDDLPVAPCDAISASFCVDELDAHRGQFAAIQDFPRSAAAPAASAHEDSPHGRAGRAPSSRSGAGTPHVPGARARRLHDLDTVWTDPNAALPGGSGHDDLVVHAAAAQHYSLLRYGLHPSDTPSDLANSSTAGFRNGGSAALESNPSRS